MKIKKFKLTPRFREVYNELKQRNIKITPEIETLVQMYDKQISDLLSSSVLFETYETKSSVISEIKKFIEIPKNASLITFIVSTLGVEVEELEKKENEELKNVVLEVLLLEYLDSSLRFVFKILQEQTEENYELSTIFNSPKELISEVFKLINPEKISVSYDNNIFRPKYTSVNYLFWFSNKK